MAHDRVLVEQVEVSTSGIVLPDGVSVDSRKKLIVVAVGPGRINDAGVEVKAPCNVGDSVVVIPGSGIRIPIGGRTYAAFDSSHIIGILNESFIKELEADTQIKKSLIAG